LKYEDIYINEYVTPKEMRKPPRGQTYTIDKIA